MRRCLPLAVALLCLTGCPESQPLGDAGPADSGASAADSGLWPDASSADTGASEDAGGLDSGAEDAAVMDAQTSPDAQPDSGAQPDAGPIDSGEPPEDAGPLGDAGPDAGPRPDAGACNYIDLSVCIVDCGTYTYARQFVDTLGVCPDYYRLNGNDYPDINAAITGEACNSACIFKAFQSVSFIDHCGRRNGYIIYRARDTKCGELYEFSSGLFPSVADWQAATPCPG